MITGVPVELANPSSKPGRTIRIMAALCSGGASIFLDSVIVSTALATISRDLGSSIIKLAWTGAAYLLASATLLPIWAPLSDSYGQRLVLVGGMVAFLVGSLIAGLAQNMKMLLAGRAVQGAGGGAIIVISNIVITHMFSIRERGLYIAIFSAVSGFAASFGPLLGGLLAEYAGWRWCFWINLPIIFTAILLSWMFFGHSKERDISVDLPIDWLDCLLIATGTALMLVGIQLGTLSHTWHSPTVVGLIVGGGVALMLFAIQQSISPNPIIPMRMILNRTSAACLLLCFAHGWSFIAVIFYLPIYYQLVLSASAASARLWLLILVVPSTLFTVVAALAIRRTGRYQVVIWVCTAALCLGLGLCITFPLERSWIRIGTMQLILAVGMGPLFQAPLIALHASISASELSRANGAYAFTRALSSAISLIVGQVILQGQLSRLLTSLLGQGISPELLFKLSPALSSFGDMSALPDPMCHLVRRALVESLRRVWIVQTAVAGVGLLASLFVQHRELSVVRPGIDAEKA